MAMERTNCNDSPQASSLINADTQEAILEDLKKHFHHELQESFPDTRHVLLKRRRALYPDNVNIKPQYPQNLRYTLQKIKKLDFEALYLH